MPSRQARNDCKREPAKHVPTITEVQVCDIPRNFPSSCKNMIGKIYSAIMHIDRKGKIWYNILKEDAFGEKQLQVVRSSMSEESKRVSFLRRKYVTLEDKYCH